MASDTIGRALWVLEIDGERGRLRAPRERRACRLGAGEPVALPEIDLPVPARELPAVLLGRLPAPPEIRRRAAAEGAGRWTDEATGELWTVELADGALARWKVERAGAERLAWRREGARSILTVEGGRVELEWRETASERLESGPPAWSVRPEPTEECRDAARP